MIGLAALHMADAGTLAPPLVVTTIMSNYGLRTRLAEAGIEVIQTPVGDRHVSNAIRETSARLGGEPSGHIVFAEHSPTGDGILTAVKLLEIAHQHAGANLGTLARSIPLFPQVLRNVACASPENLASDDRVLDCVRAAEAALGEAGRVLVRPSGTQPLLRILVEARDESTCARIADEIEDAVTEVATA